MLFPSAKLIGRGGLLPFTKAGSFSENLDGWQASSGYVDRVTYSARTGPACMYIAPEGRAVMTFPAKLVSKLKLRFSAWFYGPGSDASTIGEALYAIEGGAPTKMFDFLPNGNQPYLFYAGDIPASEGKSVTVTLYCKSTYYNYPAFVDDWTLEGSKP